MVIRQSIFFRNLECWKSLENRLMVHLSKGLMLGMRHIIQTWWKNSHWDWMLEWDLFLFEFYELNFLCFHWALYQLHWHFVSGCGIIFPIETVCGRTKTNYSITIWCEVKGSFSCTWWGLAFRSAEVHTATLWWGGLVMF